MSKEPQENASMGANFLQEQQTPYGGPSSEIDLSLLMDSLAKTPWERMQANDDALNFGESLRSAMEKRRA